MGWLALSKAYLPRASALETALAVAVLQQRLQRSRRI
jgi:hypothetical protein